MTNAAAAAYILFPDSTDKSRFREARIDLEIKHAATPIWDEVQLLFWQDHFGRWDRVRLIKMAQLLGIPYNNRSNTGTIRANMVDWWRTHVEELSQGVN